jgi:hypothetical protein
MMSGLRSIKQIHKIFKIKHNDWRYGLVKADHCRPIEEQNLIQPLLTIPLVICWAVLKR